MPTVSVKIDSQSKYTIELNPEYSPQEFIDTARKHIKFVNEIISGHEKIIPQESPAAQTIPDRNSETPDRDIEPPQKQIPISRPDLPPKTAPPFRPKNILFKVLLYTAVALAFACGGVAVYLWHTGIDNLAPEKAAAPPVFKAKIAPPNPVASEEVAAPSPSAVPLSAVTGKKKYPPLPSLNKLIIVAREPAWLRIREDRNPAYEIMLGPGEKLEREAAKFTVKIGNARGVSVMFNNKQISLTDPISARIRRNVVSLKLPGH